MKQQEAYNLSIESMEPNQNLMKGEQVERKSLAVDRSLKIKIAVEQPQLNNYEPISFYDYQVNGEDCKGKFSIRRRYNDFDFLRDTLTSMWIGIYIPPIPDKKITGNTETKFIQVRRKFFHNFCQDIAERPYLFYCDTFQTFIRGGLDFQRLIETNAVVINYDFLLPKYVASFGEMESKFEQSTQKLIGKNEEDLIFLKKSEETLMEVLKQLVQVSDSKENYNKQFNQCFTSTFIQYEEQHYLLHLNHDRQKLILNRNQQFLVAMAEFQKINCNNSFEEFVELNLYEIKSTLALIEAIQGRKEAEKIKYKLKAKLSDYFDELRKTKEGRTTFRSLFRSGSKELQINQLEMKVVGVERQLYGIQKMIRLMVMNSQFELQKYRLKRGKNYAQVFRSVAQKQMKEIAQYTKLLAIPQSNL